MFVERVGQQKVFFDHAARHAQSQQQQRRRNARAVFACSAVKDQSGVGLKHMLKKLSKTMGAFAHQAAIKVLHQLAHQRGRELLSGFGHVLHALRHRGFDGQRMLLQTR